LALLGPDFADLAQRQPKHLEGMGGVACEGERQEQRGGRAAATPVGQSQRLISPLGKAPKPCPSAPDLRLMR
jgi:hypothetical protein